jgi:hypothetical protein
MDKLTGAVKDTANPSTQQGEAQKTASMTPNFITYLRASDFNSAPYAAVVRKTINALTGQIVEELDWHVIKRNAGQEVDTPTLDQRNEIDEHNRGQEVKDYMTESSGFEVRVPNYRIAELCNGLRFVLYDELARFDDVPDPMKILITDPKGVDPAELRMFPMSIESAMNGRIERLGTPSRRARATGEERAVVLGVTKEVVETELANTAKREQKRALERRADVMAEALSLDHRGTDDDWMALPKLVRDRLLTKIRNNLIASRDKFKSLGIGASPEFYQQMVEAVKDHDLAVAIIDAFLAEHPVADITEARTMRAKATLSSLGGSYKPAGGVAEMHDDPV